jgi:sugar-specific transcriptional regulator TrmB
MANDRERSVTDGGTDADAAGAVTAENEAVAAFERLGLTSYEAKVFIALQRVGTGTAREVSEVTDVPRSQVYSVTDSLADRGLVSVQQSNPKRFRPVSVEAARSTLRDRFERESDRAFAYVEQVQTEGEEREREEIWTIRGRDAVTDRVVELIGTAEERIVVGLPTPELVTDGVAEAVAAAVEAGIEVAVVSDHADVRERFDGGVTACDPPAAVAGNGSSGRLLFVDDDTLLLSVLEGDGDEMAVWSADSRFAGVFIRLVEDSLGL